MNHKPQINPRTLSSALIALTVVVVIVFVVVARFTR